MRKRKNAKPAEPIKADPVKTDGTTEAPHEFLNEETKDRFEEMEARKEKDIETLRKESNGKPKI